MTEWYTAAELAGLPGLPGTERRIRDRAAREQWQSRPRAHGKGIEYHISALPLPAQAHLFRQQVIEPERETLLHIMDPGADERQRRREQGLARWAGLQSDDPRRLRAEARAWLLQRWDEYAREWGTVPGACADEFGDAYQAGRIEIPEEHQCWLPRCLSKRTLFRWRQAYREQGIYGLVSQYGNRRGRDRISTTPELQSVILGAMYDNPEITPRRIKEYLVAAYPHLNIVSERAIGRWMARWKRDNAQFWTYITNPDEWKNKYMVAFGSHTERVTHINHVWEIDSTPADWMLTDGRHTVIGVIDLHTRQLRFRVSKTSKATAVCAALRDAMREWGVPEIVRTDNGQDYVSRQFTDALAGLGITHELCLPFASEQKGTIERAMRTMSHGLLELLPGFIGHNVAQRKAIEARRSFAERIMKRGEVVEVSMTAAELQRRLDDWCRHVYAHNPHEGLGGRTPFEVAAAAGKVKRITDDRALDALLMEIAGTRVVTKKGIRYEHYHYIAPELAAYVGQQVKLKRDPDELAKLFVYDADGVFICVAIAHELRGISRTEAAAVTKAKQRELLAAQRKEAARHRRAIKSNIAEVVLQHRIEQSEKVALLPRAAEAHNTPDLAQAARAARSQDGPRDSGASDEARELHEQMVAEWEAGVARINITPMREAETPRQTFQRWVRLWRAARDGKSLSPDELEFLTYYVQQIEFRTELRLHREFGLLVDGEPVEAEVEAEQEKGPQKQAERCDKE